MRSNAGMANPTVSTLAWLGLVWLGVAWFGLARVDLNRGVCYSMLQTLVSCSGASRCLTHCREQYVEQRRRRCAVW